MKKYFFLQVLIFSVITAYASEERASLESRPVPSLLALSLQAVGKQAAEKLAEWVHSGDSKQIAIQEVVSDFCNLNVLLKDLAVDKHMRVLEQLISQAFRISNLGIHAAFSCPRWVYFHRPFPREGLFSYNADGSFIAFAQNSDDQKWQVIDANTGRVVFAGSCIFAIKKICFTEDGHWLAVQDREGVIYLHSVTHRDEAYTLHTFRLESYGRSMQITKIVITSNSEKALIGFQNNNFQGNLQIEPMVALLNIKQDYCSYILQKEKILGCAADEKSFITNVTASGPGIVRIRDLETSNVKYREDNAYGRVSPKGNYLYVDIQVSTDTNLAIMNNSWRHEIIDLSSVQKVVKLPGPVCAVADDERLLCLRVNNQAVVFDFSIKKVLCFFPPEPVPCMISISPDNHLIASAYIEGNCCGTRIVDRATGQYVADFHGLQLKQWIKGTNLVLLHRLSTQLETEKFFVVDLENHQILYQCSFAEQLVDCIATNGKLWLRTPLDESDSSAICSMSHEAILKDALIKGDYDLFDALALIARGIFWEYLLKREKECSAEAGCTNNSSYVPHTSSLEKKGVDYSFDEILNDAVRQSLFRLTNQPRSIIKVMARYQMMIDAIDKAIIYERSQPNSEMPPLKKRCIEKSE